VTDVVLHSKKEIRYLILSKFTTTQNAINLKLKGSGAIVFLTSQVRKATMLLLQME
jgi:hypothetical protein